jgi:plastocyanin
VSRLGFGGFITLAVLAAALASCSKGGDGAKAPAPSASADAAAPSGPLTLTIQDHKFTPAELIVPAHQAVEIELINKDPVAEEFDSSALKVEKVVAGGQTGTLRIKPLDPGTYPYIGEFHSETAKGVVIAK